MPGDTLRRRTVVWVVTLATIGLIFDGFDLVVYGTVVSTFLRDPTEIGEVTPTVAGALGSYALGRHPGRRRCAGPAGVADRGRGDRAPDLRPGRGRHHRQRGVEQRIAGGRGIGDRDAGVDQGDAASQGEVEEQRATEPAVEVGGVDQRPAGPTPGWASQHRTGSATSPEAPATRCRTASSPPRVLQRDDRKVLGFIPVHRTHEADARLHHDLVDHLHDAVVLGHRPSRETAALSSLALAVGLERHLFGGTGGPSSSVWPRSPWAAWVGSAVRHAIDAVNAGLGITPSPGSFT